MRACCLWIGLAVVVVLARDTHSHAQQLAPLPRDANSIEVIDEGAYVQVAPRESAARRGTLMRGAHLAIRGRVVGEGCSTGSWFAIYPDGFVCGRYVRLSTAAPETVDRADAGGALPYEYAVVTVDGTRGYSQPRDADADEYFEAYGSGFGLAIAGHTTHRGQRFARTFRGVFVEEDALRYVSSTEFRGTPIASAINVAWVTARSAIVRAQPRGREVTRLPRLTRLQLDTSVDGAWLRLQDGTYVSSRDVTRPVLRERPPELAETQRWVDVNVATQTMVAYEGSRPVYATAISTGRRGAHTSTPLGLHKVWAKLRTSDMDDLEREDIERNYAMQAVPWVQYFEHSNGFHAAFWHERFGERHSHGCVNLSPFDARWLFEWSTPALPVGWSAILPQDGEPTLAVLVHE